MSPYFWKWPICTALLLYAPENQLLKRREGICPHSMSGAKLWRAALLHSVTKLANYRLEGTSWDCLVQSHLFKRDKQKQVSQACIQLCF